MVADDCVLVCLGCLLTPTALPKHVTDMLVQFPTTPHAQDLGRLDRDGAPVSPTGVIIKRRSREIPCPLAVEAFAAHLSYICRYDDKYSK